jgi:hydroxyacylglutathione hydrolase
MATIHILRALESNFIYVLEDPEGVAAIDPGEAGPVRNFLQERGLRLDLILNTHHHGDHVGGNEALRKSGPAEVAGPDRDGIPGLDRRLGEGDTVEVGRTRLEVLATPGHGRTDPSFYAEADGALFSGDTLFCGGCGRLFECGPEVMWASLCRLARLPDETRIYCGHEYTVKNLEFARSVEPEREQVAERLEEARRLVREGQPTVPGTMGRERDTNPFLRAGSPDLKRALGMEDAADVEVFAELRRRKDAF